MAGRMLAIAAVALLSGCYTFSQGEWFDAKAVPQLKAGMTKAEVLTTIGRPQLAYSRDDGAEVWAYQYARDQGIDVHLVIIKIETGDPESHALTLAFNGDALSSVEHAAYLGRPGKGPLQVHRGQAIELPEGKAKKKGSPKA